MTDKEKLREDFNNFKNILTNEIESMKFSFYKELNSFKNQLLETSDIGSTRLQSQTDNINTSNILERLVNLLQGQVSTLKYQLDRKDKIINTLLKNLEKRILKKFLLLRIQEWFICYSNFIRYSSYLCKHIMAISKWIKILQLTTYQQHKLSHRH